MVYVPVPKAACSSLKLAMHRLEHDTEFTGVRKGLQKKGIHTAYPTRAFDTRDFADMTDPWIFTVLRDPAERVLSTWSDRIVTARRLVKAERASRVMRCGKALLSFGTSGQERVHVLDPVPDVESFILNLQAYFDRYEAVRHHIGPVREFIWDDLSIYADIYTTKDISRLTRDIRCRTGQGSFEIPRANATEISRRVSLDELSDRAFYALMDWLASEYQALSDIFTPPARGGRQEPTTGA